ncbi:MAG: phenylacetate-CoA oxygenase subunit PaaC [Actinobacteria bacterium]|nr:phenylacetate-CoA oxygenase subunit PaaC [Actinomycetota bacterium]
MSDILAAILIALADDELIIGHRHSEWTGFAPHMEEDVAFSSIAQDEIGHASAYYSLASTMVGQTPDQLAFGREPGEYHNAVLCERPNGDWAYTLARHWLYDNADALRLEALERSSRPELALLAAKIRREERWHSLHAELWVKRVAEGSVEGRGKLLHALAEAFAEVRGLFEPFDNEERAIAQGWLTVPSPVLGARFVETTTAALDDLGLPVEIEPGAITTELIASSSGDLIATDEDSASITPAGGGLGGRYGRHSDDFKALWAAMTATYKIEPEATW